MQGEHLSSTPSLCSLLYFNNKALSSVTSLSSCTGNCDEGCLSHNVAEILANVAEIAAAGSGVECACEEGAASGREIIGE